VLSALFNVPDPGLVVGLGAAADVVDASYPWSSLGVAIAAAVTAGLVLAPLDLVRTKSVFPFLEKLFTNDPRLILTPTSEAKRSLAYNLHALPSYFCPSPLLMPTILHSIVDPTISHCTPILLRSRLSIDPVLTPNTYDLCRFVSRTLELFIKLPLETVLRRGQMSVLASEEYSTAGNESLRTMVEIGPYRGVIGTMWSIVREEGSPNQETLVGATGKSAKGRKKAGRKGQGVEGLWRGWRVGMWGLVGVCGTRALGGDRNCGGEF
jgi:mitochondrial fusion and transport protein UGO1